MKTDRCLSSPVRCARLRLGGIRARANAATGGLAPYYDQGISQAFPAGIPGIAPAAQLVYAIWNAPPCHTPAGAPPRLWERSGPWVGRSQSVAAATISFACRPTRTIAASTRSGDPRRPQAQRSGRSGFVSLLYTGRGGCRISVLFRPAGLSDNSSDLALALTGRYSPAAAGSRPSRRAQAWSPICSA